MENRNSVLPQDSMMAILSRVPVRSLMRWKAVCKPWSRLPTNPYFTTMHAENFTNGVPIVHKCHTLHLTNAGLNPHRRPSHVRDTQLRCCNGFVCVGRPMISSQFILWNPATRLQKVISAANGDFKNLKSSSIGLGCSGARDFKVVRLLQFKEPPEMLAADVYSSTSNSWTRMELGFHGVIWYAGDCTVVKGNPHWVIHNSDSKKQVILRFDATNMAFHVLDYPPELKILDFQNFLIVDWSGGLGGLLCVHDAANAENKLKRIEVWLYEDEDKKWRRKSMLEPQYLRTMEGFCVCLAYNHRIGKIVGTLQFKNKHGCFFTYDVSNGNVDFMGADRVNDESYRLSSYDESLAFVDGMVTNRAMGETQENALVFHNQSLPGFLVSCSGRVRPHSIEIFFSLA